MTTMQQVRAFICSCDHETERRISGVRKVLEELTEGLDKTEQCLVWMLFHKWAAGEYEQVSDKIYAQTLRWEEEDVLREEEELEEGVYYEREEPEENVPF